MSFCFEVEPALAGKRIDQAVAERVRELSRSQVRRLIGSGAITVAGLSVKPSHRLRAGERVAGRIPEPEPAELEPEPIPLTIAYEDEHLIVVDKPPGLVVHPAPGHWSGTLVNALLHHCPDLAGVGGVRRPGIVHRLDKDTSGLLVVAKSDRAHRGLSAQLKARDVSREYLALVRGRPGAQSGSVDAPIGRGRGDRKKLSTKTRSGRPATTLWRVEERLGELTLLRVTLETGRTHQIRVHLASIGLPVAGDPVYGRGRAAARALGLERQALHAARLGFAHPITGAPISLVSSVPPDMQAVLERLRS